MQTCGAAYERGISQSRLEVGTQNTQPHAAAVREVAGFDMIYAASKVWTVDAQVVVDSKSERWCSWMQKDEATSHHGTREACGLNA